jgi:hypothetical protein
MEVIMERVSHIVPASTRQVWSSGEIEKPRRITEPNAIEHVQGGVSSVKAAGESLPVSFVKPEQAIVERDPNRGGRLNMMA